jgi:hypothetical protein
MFRAILVAGALLAPATALAAAAPAPANKDVSGVTVTAKKAAGGLDQKEVVCHKEQVLGTLFPKEICARREDIAERKRVDQASTREAQALRPWQDEAAAK